MRMKTKNKSANRVHSLVASSSNFKLILMAVLPKPKWITLPCECQAEVAVTGQVDQHPDCTLIHTVVPDDYSPTINTTKPKKETNG